MLMDEKFLEKLIAIRRKSLLDGLVSLAGALDEKQANMFAGALRELKRIEKEKELAIEKKRAKPDAD